MRLHKVRERGSAPEGGRHSVRLNKNPLSVKTLLVKCPAVQWQPDGLTLRTQKWFAGAGFLGAPPISLTQGLVGGVGGVGDAGLVFAAGRSPAHHGLRPPAPHPSPTPLPGTEEGCHSDPGHAYFMMLQSGAPTLSEGVPVRSLAQPLCAPERPQIWVGQASAERSGSCWSWRARRPSAWKADSQCRGLSQTRWQYIRGGRVLLTSNILDLLVAKILDLWVEKPSSQHRGQKQAWQVFGSAGRALGRDYDATDSASRPPAIGIV